MRAGTWQGVQEEREDDPHTRCHISERGPNHVTLMSSHPRLFSHFLYFRPVQPPCPSNPRPNLGQYPHVESRHGFKHRRAYVLSTGGELALRVDLPPSPLPARHPLADRRSITPEIVSPIYYHPPISLLLPSSPTSFIPTRTMFVIKATLKDETRRLTFDTSHFPRYYEVQQKVSLT